MHSLDAISPVQLLVLQKQRLDRYIARFHKDDNSDFKQLYVIKSNEFDKAIEILKGSAKLTKPDQITETDRKESV